MLQVETAGPERRRVFPAGVSVSASRPPLSALYSKPQPLPYRHTRRSCVQGGRLHQKTLQIALAVSVCCHTLESHSGAG